MTIFEDFFLFLFMRMLLLLKILSDFYFIWLSFENRLLYICWGYSLFLNVTSPFIYSTES